MRQAQIPLSERRRTTLRPDRRRSLPVGVDRSSAVTPLAADLDVLVKLEPWLGHLISSLLPNTGFFAKSSDSVENFCRRFSIRRLTPCFPCPFLKWRRRRDLNPRDPFEPNGFQDRRFQPLTHSSVSKYNLQQLLAGLLVTILGSVAAFWCVRGRRWRWRRFWRQAHVFCPNPTNLILLSPNRIEAYPA